MQEYTGKVVRKPFGVGTKSEHDAVCLETGGRSYVLRRQGGNPFQDPQLDALVGKSIRCKGEVLNYTLIITGWTVLDG